MQFIPSSEMKCPKYGFLMIYRKLLFQVVLANGQVIRTDFYSTVEMFGGEGGSALSPNKNRPIHL